MNKSEYLLTCLIEECAEVQHRTCKFLRFGPHDHHPAKLTDNTEELQAEIADLIAVLLLVIDDEILPEIDEITLSKMIADKQAKVAKYMEYSVNCGTLKEDTDDRPESENTQPKLFP